MRILIIGCGRVGAGLATVLYERGHTVVIVDKDPLAFEKLGDKFKGQMVRNGWDDIINGPGFRKKLVKKNSPITNDGFNGKFRNLFKMRMISIDHRDPCMKTFVEYFQNRLLSKTATPND